MYEFKKKDSTTGYILNNKTDEIVCIVGTKRPDLEFGSLKAMIDKANKCKED